MKYFTDGTNVYAYELDGSQDEHIKEGLVPITEAEADVIRANNRKKLFDSLTHVEKRAMEYPSIQNQLDTIFHSGLDAWKQQIQAIKDKYPKQ